MTRSVPPHGSTARPRARTRGLRRFPREREPEGLAEAVPVAALTLALMTAITAVGFAWDRRQAGLAHDYAVELVERLAVEGAGTRLPRWSGHGEGPGAATAVATFDAAKTLGGFVAREVGTCRHASKFSVCTGTRYRCDVAGDSPAGPVAAAIGLCDGGSHPGWSFDSLDLMLPVGAENRTAVDPNRDGLIQYGATPPAADVIGPKLRRRGMPPFVR